MSPGNQYSCYTHVQNLIHKTTVTQSHPASPQSHPDITRRAAPATTLDRATVASPAAYLTPHAPRVCRMHLAFAVCVRALAREQRLA